MTSSEEASLDPRVLVYIDAARRRERPALQLARRRDWVSALRLHAEAVSLLMRAKLASAGEPRALDELLPSDLLDALCERLHAEGRAAPAELERLRPLLAAREWDAFDRLSDSDAERAADELAVATRFLAGTIPVLAQRERRRELRVFALGTALLALALAGALLWSLTRPANLALNQPVSSTPAGWNTNAEDAVNGVRFGELGYHSESADAPWLQVDLGAEHPIRRVLVYGRGDCCFDQSIPMVVEGSLDGQAFVVLAQRDQPFQPFRPWVLAPSGTRARYVRVHPLKRVPLVVAELEVY